LPWRFPSTLFQLLGLTKQAEFRFGLRVILFSNWKKPIFWHFFAELWKRFLYTAAQQATQLTLAEHLLGSRFPIGRTAMNNWNSRVGQALFSKGK
jgi:hypothetical protein